ncbi:aldo/keto reductase [Zunongwangia endophytica]|uniref:Aldo/keto reductase n=1 Tax=Zunongwangia endophytica TaxID=1808945 RepID=A0ABV8HH02_9FLAO|nr:aldo/keto reductase [Zunongwangia endophytica]MDN3593430.1 aldo/keto reductase [Zunongwangia endophytica]
MKITDINGRVQLNNGLDMPYLGLGVYKTKDGEEVRNAIHYALKAGYRHIDTASFYKNEEGVGAAIIESGIAREEIFITSKVWNDDQGYEGTLEAIDESLEKLKMDYLDLYLIHWPVPDTLNETWRAMEEIYKSGKVKAIGLCNCVEHQMDTVIENGSIKPMLLQNEFHPKLLQQNMLDFCAKNNIQYEGWSPLMRGQILDNNIIKNIAEKYGKSTAQVVLRWDLQKGVITIPKSVHQDRIEQNAAIFDFELSEVEVKQIDSLDNDKRTGAHPDHFMEHFADK